MSSWNKTSPGPVVSQNATKPGTGSNGVYHASVQQQQNQEPDPMITQRMKARVIQTNEVGDTILKNLDQQNEIIKKQQDEIAETHDTLNVAERKLKGIGSFFGNLTNAFKKDNSKQHQKVRQDYEKQLAKEKFKKNEETATQEDKDLELAKKQYDVNVKVAMQAESSNIRQAGKESKAQIKTMKKNPSQQQQQQDTGNMVSGSFIFKEITVAETCQAEKDVEEIGKYVEQLKVKAVVMGDSIQESNERLSDLTSEMARAQARTQNAIHKGEKIIK